MKFFKSFSLTLITAAALFLTCSPAFAITQQELVQGLNNVSSSINQNTQALNKLLNAYQDNITRQQIAALNQDCVGKATAYIRDHDVYLNQTNQMLNDYEKKMETMSMSDPSTASQASSYVNYLSGLIKAQTKRYNDMIISTCVSYVPPSNPSASISQQPANTILCNGKFWNFCPSGYNFSCPATGGPQCLPNQLPTIPTPPNNIQANTSNADPGQFCKELYGIHAVELNNGVCACEQGYHIPKNSEGYVVDPRKCVEGVEQTMEKAAESTIKNEQIRLGQSITAGKNPSTRPAQVETTTSNINSADKDAVETKAADIKLAPRDDSWHLGLIQKFWTWLTGLFH